MARKLASKLRFGEDTLGGMIKLLSVVFLTQYGRDLYHLQLPHLSLELLYLIERWKLQ